MGISYDDLDGILSSLNKPAKLKQYPKTKVKKVKRLMLGYVVLLQAVPRWMDLYLYSLESLRMLG